MKTNRLTQVIRAIRVSLNDGQTFITNNNLSVMI